MKKHYLLGAIILLSSNLHAGMALNCSEAANMDDKQVGYCVEQESDFMKQNLNDLSKKFTHLSWSKIETSQKAWNSYMQANCEFHKLNAGGGGADIRAVNECKVRMTLQRNAELEYMNSQ